MHKIEQKVEKTVSAIRKNAGNVTPCAKVKGLFYMYRLFHKKRKMNPVDDEYWYQKGYVTGKPLEKRTIIGNHKEFLAEILDRLSGLDGVTHRPMMGEYILYYNGKIVGGIYDNRLLVKPVKLR